MNKWLLCLAGLAWSAWNESTALGTGMGMGGTGLSYQTWTAQRGTQWTVLPYYQSDNNGTSAFAGLGYQRMWSLGTSPVWKMLGQEAYTRQYLQLGVQTFNLYESTFDSIQEYFSYGQLYAGLGRDQQWGHLRLSYGMGLAALAGVEKQRTYIPEQILVPKIRLTILPGAQASLHYAWGAQSDQDRDWTSMQGPQWQYSHALGVQAGFFGMGVGYKYWGENYGFSIIGLPLWDRLEPTTKTWGLSLMRHLSDLPAYQGWFGPSASHAYSFVQYSGFGMSDAGQWGAKINSQTIGLGFGADWELGLSRIGMQLGYVFTKESNEEQSYRSNPGIGISYEMIVHRSRK